MTPWIAACQASLSIINSRRLLKLVHQVGDAIQPAHLLSSPSPPAFNLAKLGGQKSEGGSGGSDQLEAEEDWPRVVGHSETVQLRMGFEPMF